MKPQVDKVIGFDMDGVIVNHIKNKIKLAKQFGVKITPAQTPSEIIKTTMPLPQYRELQYLLYDHPEIGLSAPLMPGVKGVLAEIKKKKIPYFLISRRKNRTAPSMAVKLLAKHGLWPKYFNEKNSHFVEEIKDKETKAKELGITHYIDDEGKVLAALASVKNKFLFDSLGVFKSNPYKKVVSWKEISELI